MLEDEYLLNETWVELPILCAQPMIPEDYDVAREVAKIADMYLRGRDEGYQRGREEGYQRGRADESNYRDSARAEHERCVNAMAGRAGAISYCFASEAIKNIQVSTAIDLPSGRAIASVDDMVRLKLSLYSNRF